MFFYTGQRVILLTSTQKKKGSAIRKGSVGYMSNMGPVTKVPYLNTDLYVTQSDIIFSRYGFETEKSRSEKKKVVVVLPMLSMTKQFKEDYTSFIEKIDKETPNKDLQKIIMGHTGSPYTICIVAPYMNKLNLATCSKNEFVSWLNSYLFCEDSRQALREVSHNLNALKLHENVLDYERIRTLCNMAYDKGEKLEKIDAIANSPAERQRTIRALYSCLSFFMARVKNDTKSWYESKIAGGKYGNSKDIKKSKMVEDIVSYFYKEDMYSWILTTYELFKLGSSNGSFDKFKIEIDSNKRELLALSRSLRSL